VLKELSVLLDEGGAQRLVALHQLLEGAAKHLHIQLAGQAHGDGDVEGGATGFQLLLEPHAFLREGGWGAAGGTGLFTQQLCKPCALLLRSQCHIPPHECSQ
jgi:hypothetical protein